MNKKYNVIDLFSGAGGLGLGFEKANFEINLAIEQDESAVETYKYNHKNTKVICSDIKNIKTKEYNLGKIDGIIGGPPCQGFSLSGKRDPKDPRNSLFMEFIRIVNEQKPIFIVMENVKGLLSMKLNDGSYVKDIIINEFDKIGYSVKYKVLDSSEYGVPQKRERVFFIGTLHNLKIDIEEFFPIPRSTFITIEQALSDLPIIKAGQGEHIQKYPIPPQNEYQNLIRKDSEFVYNHQAMKHTQRILDRFSIIKEGQSLKDVPKEHSQRQRGKSDEISGKVYSQNNMRPYYDKPSPTITASFQSNFVHPKLNRNFTAREACRLQSFPDTYIIKGKRTTMSWEKNLSQYQQIGNAVPPLLAKAIGEQVYSVLKNNEGALYGHTLK